MKNSMARQVSLNGNEDIQCYQHSQEDYEPLPNMRDLIGGGPSLNQEEDDYDSDDMVECSQKEISDIQSYYTQCQYGDDSDDDDEEEENRYSDQDNYGAHLEIHSQSQSQDTGAIQAHIEVAHVASSSNRRDTTMTQFFQPEKFSSSSRTPTSTSISRTSKLSLSTNTKRRKLENSHPTMTQIYGNEPVKPDQEKSTCVDTDEKVFLESRCFKVGEAFKVKDSEYKGSVLVIDSFGWESGFKIGVGMVYQKLKKTAMGGIQKKKPFNAYLQALNLDWERYVKFEQKKSIKLRHLGIRHKNFQPPKSSDEIIYEKNFHKGGFGHTLADSFITYKHAKPNCKVEEDDHEMVQENSPVDWDFPGLEDFDVDAVISQHKTESEVKCYQLQKKINDLKQTIKRMKSESNNSNKLKVLDIFAGIGGMSCGFLKSGVWDVPFAVENNPNASAIFSLNHRNTHLFEENVCDWFQRVQNAHESDSTNDVNPYGRVLKEVNHIHFSPPCQKFSCANSTGGKNDEKNAKCTLDSIDIIKFFTTFGNVRSISMENVPNLLNPMDGNADYMKCVISTLYDLGMDVMLRVLDSSSYGDPQKRERVFIVAWKLDLLDFVFPEATHGEGKELAIVTVSKALHDLSKVEPTDGSGTTVLRKDGDTFLLKNHCIRRTKVSDPVYLQPNEPSNTVIRKGNIMHYEQDRTLTTAEKAQLFSFPYNFQFCGAEKHHIDGIGNAVPVNMARAVALALALIYGIKEENIDSES